MRLPAQPGVRQRPVGCYNEHMNASIASLLSLPDWLPWWVPMAVLVPGLLYLLVFLVMPFSVFGVKARLEAIEVRLDEIQGEIRSLVLRMPELRGRGQDWTDLPPPIAPARADDNRPVRPPIPPAPVLAPRRPPLEPPTLERSHRAPPEQQDGKPPDRAPPDPGQPPRQTEIPGPAVEEPGALRRRPLTNPGRPPRNEPRVDWPG